MKHYPYVPGYPKPDYPDCMPESDCCGDKAHHCPPPPPPCPGMPGPGPGEFIPVPPPIEPLHPVPGCNTQEQMVRIVHKTNECISKWNNISSNCYAALNRVVGAAVSNDVYYDRDEVHLENGYSSNDECAYHIITIRSVDKCNQPIRVKLKTAYDNTTNANVRQSMQDVSFIENANAVITAVDPAQTGWKGTTFYCGAPIAGTQETDGYVGGFNDHGALKVFPASVDDLTLRQNCVVDIIGLVTPIITNGEITEQAKAMTTKASISAIGYRSGNGDKIFFQCSAEADKGMQGITVANILKDMGCTTAIITCAGENSLNVKFSNGMMYMGTLTDVPNGWLMPSNCAYWVVSKRPFDGWKNKFTAEIADLVQRVGGSYNEILNNKHRIEIVNKLAESNRDRLDDAEARLDTIEETLVIHGEKINKLERDLAQEITDRTNEIKRVDGRIDQEITDRTEADEALGHRIDQEITDRTNADNALDEKITQETTERKAADATLQSNIDKEAKARADADLAEENERKHQDSLLHDEIDKERSARSDADADLASKIQKEASDRAAADTKLTNDLAAEATARKDADVELTNEISAEATARKDADTALRNQIERLSTGQDVIPIYVKKAGDTMTGNLNMSGNSVTNVEGIGFNQGIHLDEADGRLNVLQGNDFKPMAGLDAVNDDEFVTKRQLDAKSGIGTVLYCTWNEDADLLTLDTESLEKLNTEDIIKEPLFLCEYSKDPTGKLHYSVCCPLVWFAFQGCTPPVSYVFGGPQKPENASVINDFYNYGYKVNSSGSVSPIAYGQIKISINKSGESFGAPSIVNPNITEGMITTAIYYDVPISFTNNYGAYPIVAYKYTSNKLSFLVNDGASFTWVEMA